MIGMPPYASDGDCDGGGPGAQELVTRLCRMRPALPASSAHLRRDADDDARGFAGCATGLPTTAAPARSSARPRAVTCGKENTTNRARPFLIRRCLAFYHPTGPELLRQKRKGARGAVSSSSDVGQERIGLRGASSGAALQAQQGARSGGGYAPSIDRCARSVLLLTRRSCSRADQLCAGTRTKHQWKTFHSH